MFNLRPYQLDAIENIKDAYKRGLYHLILQAATGAGKTVIFSNIAKMTSDRGKKVLILTDRAELLNQAGGTLAKNGLAVNYLIAGSQVIDQDYKVFVAMSQTLKKRVKEPKLQGDSEKQLIAFEKQKKTFEYWTKFLSTIDLLIIDECHKQEFNYIFLSGIFDKKHVLGFTATPCRTGKMRQLGLDYETIIETISIKELISLNYLLNDDYYGLTPPDMSGVEFDKMKGDYRESSMFKKYNSPEVYAGAVKGYQKNTPGTKVITFCVNIEHVIKTCIEFNNAGIKSKFLVSTVSKPKYPNDEDLGKIAQYTERLRVYNLYQENLHLTGKRKDVLTEFKNNEFAHLVNSGILTTGYDEPGLVTGIILRATMSLALYLQMIGRLSRIFEGKTHFNILDFGDNKKRFGNYTDDRLWSLWHEESEGGGLPPIKNCGVDGNGRPINDKKGCTRPILAAYKICPFCGFLYPAKEKKEIDIDLLIENQERTRTLKVVGIKEMTFEQLKEYWELKGHKSPWLWYQLYTRGGNKEIEEFGKENNWSKTTILKAIAFVGG